jgi:flavoprotein
MNTNNFAFIGVHSRLKKSSPPITGAFALKKFELTIVCPKIIAC